MALMFTSNNLAARIFERQFVSPRPGASVNFVRQLYENLVPSCTIYDVDCPDNSFRKFTDDGHFLISFSKNHQDVIIYRPVWLSFSCKEEDCDSHDLPQKAKRFDSFFTQLYCLSLASRNEFICRDFFLYVESHQFGLFATSTAQNHEATATEGSINGVPSIEKITFHLVRLEDGVVLDEKVFCNDFVNLSHNMGVFLYENLVCILSLRYQVIHILQIWDSGSLVDVRTIGTFCREDDELFLNSHAQMTIPYNQVTQGSSFLSGFKQRLLSFMFCNTWNEETDQTLRAQCLKKKFYFHFQDYMELIMLKVQFLDRHHLLIKFGSVDGGIPRSTDNHPAFFAVYNMETTEIVSFYQNSSEELYYLFEQFFDHFHATSSFSLHSSFISSHSNNVHALDQHWCIKNKANSFSQFVRKMLISLPYTCQSQSPSPYFDLSLFRYDEKHPGAKIQRTLQNSAGASCLLQRRDRTQLISATDRHRHSTEHPIKFISRRQPNVLKFKIKPGPEAGGADARTKRISSFLFHPFLPLALSIQQTFMQPTVVNIHFRR